MFIIKKISKKFSNKDEEKREKKEEGEEQNIKKRKLNDDQPGLISYPSLDSINECEGLVEDEDKKEEVPKNEYKNIDDLQEKLVNLVEQLSGDQNDRNRQDIENEICSIYDKIQKLEISNKPTEKYENECQESNTSSINNLNKYQSTEPSAPLSSVQNENDQKEGQVINKPQVNENKGNNNINQYANNLPSAPLLPASERRLQNDHKEHKEKPKWSDFIGQYIIDHPKKDEEFQEDYLNRIIEEAKEEFELTFFTIPPYNPCSVVEEVIGFKVANVKLGSLWGNVKDVCALVWLQIPIFPNPVMHSDKSYKVTHVDQFRNHIKYCVQSAYVIGIQFFGKSQNVKEVFCKYGETKAYKIVSLFNNSFEYEPSKTVKEANFGKRGRGGCVQGIHFFLSPDIAMSFAACDDYATESPIITQRLDQKLYKSKKLERIKGPKIKSKLSPPDWSRLICYQ
jgi:hypothetical protein